MVTGDIFIWNAAYKWDFNIFLPSRNVANWSIYFPKKLDKAYLSLRFLIPDALSTIQLDTVKSEGLTNLENEYSIIDWIRHLKLSTNTWWWASTIKCRIFRVIESINTKVINFQQTNIDFYILFSAQPPIAPPRLGIFMSLLGTVQKFVDLKPFNEPESGSHNGEALRCFWHGLTTVDLLFSSWWFQPIWKISVKLDHFLQ